MLVNHIRRNSHMNLQDPTILSFINRIPIASDETIRKTLSTIYMQSSSLSSYSKRLVKHTSTLSNLKTILIASRLESLISKINDVVAHDFKNIKYIMPLRATAQRYYRQQELSVAEIEADGANTAMFIDSMKPSELDNLNDWLESNLDISILPERSGGHLTISLKDHSTNTTMNIADMGFGYSQLIPILMELWSSTKSSENTLGKNTPPTAIVIEQPELHLHPDLQAKLADIFLNISKLPEHPNKISLIIETHSPHIINRLGTLISQGNANKEDIGIYLFETDKSGNSTIRTSHFNSDGFLENWPYGFFEPNI
jgi:predicted ATP-dependent endonuclease of OLD family